VVIRPVIVLFDITISSIPELLLLGGRGEPNNQ